MVFLSLLLLDALGLEENYRKYIAPRYADKYETVFREHCRTMGRTVLCGILYFVLGAVAISWPVDYLLYWNRPEVLGASWSWHATTLVLASVLLLLYHFVPVTRKVFTELFLTGFLIVCFSIYYSLGNVGGLDTPWFYSAYCLPFVTLAFFGLGILSRLIFTMAIPSVCVIAYFGFHPEYLLDPYVGTPLVLLVVFTAFSVLLGHTIHNIYKRSFIQSRRLESSLREKETLLEEIHHRVKNNMQVITSMLNMHARERSSEEFEDVFQDIISRVQSMALIHETLYESEHLSRVNLPEYIRELSEHLLESFGSDANPELSLDIVESEVDMDTAIACGLIINEALTNAIDHGLRGTPDDRVEVSLRRTDTDGMELRISDNGRGFREDFSPEATSSTGILLIQSLVSYELDGTVDFLEDDGVTVLVRFEV